MNETRRLITFMLLSLAIIFGWQWLSLQIWGPPASPAANAPATQSVVATTGSGGGTSSGGTLVTTGPAAAPGSEAAGGQARVLPPASQPPPVVLGGAADPLQLTLSGSGAGLAQAVLPEFKGADRTSAYTFQQPYAAEDNATRALATRSVSVNGIGYDLSGAVWSLDSRTDRSATFVADLGSEARPLLRVYKTYALPDDPKADPSLGYEVKVTHRFENRSAAALAVGATLNGPTVPPREIEGAADQSILAGYLGGEKGDEFVAVTHNGVAELGPKQTFKDFTTDDKHRRLLWAGTSSVYFNALFRPLGSMQVTKVLATAVNPDNVHTDGRVALAFDTADVTVEAGKSVDAAAAVFLGPRKRELLNNAYYASYPLSYDQTLVLTSGPCGFCTFQWLISLLVGMLGAFHWLLRDWGLSIILLVILVRLALHPITKRSQMSMMKMGKMGPEIERLKKKYGDDKDELNKQMMQIYKQQGVTPILGCLPMFLQMPIWIALYSSLQTTFELRQAPFLYFFGHHLTWIHDLAKPDKLIDFGGDVHLFWSLHLSGINILPVLLAAVFFIQAQIQSKFQPPATTPEQAQQQKMMKWMSLLFPVFLYNGPSGLNLYILTSTTIGIIESKRIRDHIKQRDAAEAAGAVIVDAGPTRAVRRSGSGGATPAAAVRKGGIMGWIQDLQAKAEEMQRQAQQKRK